jgi:predicted ester cyclase
MNPAETNKEICRRFFEEVLNKGNFVVIDELVAPQVVSHSPFPGQKPGAIGVKETLMLFRKAFPDLSLTTVHLLAEADKVVGYFTVSGTHRGELMGRAPTGNKVAYEEVIVLRLESGKIVEHWAVADALSLMKGIGALSD